MATLKRLHVLIIEEIGLVPSYLFQVMDYIMRRIKDFSIPFGIIMR